MARTAVVAGTATAVSNRVSRRQASRWSSQEEAAAYEQQQQQAQYQQPQYAPPPQQYAAPPQQYAAPAPPAAPAAAGDVSTDLERLGALHTQGLLTDEEFAAAKAKLLGI